MDFSFYEDPDQKEESEELFEAKQKGCATVMLIISTAIIVFIALGLLLFVKV